MTTPTTDFRHIRTWRGSQDQAFEELCYQLRDPTPQGAELVKTGNPDGGLEWYVTFRNGVQWGWQAKYSFSIDSLLNGMEKSLKTVVEKRPKCRRLTFCIPFDLPDATEAGKRKSARQKFEDKKQSWRERIPGAERVRIELWSEGNLLERLVQHPGQRGITKFFWDQEVFSPEWCVKRMSIAHESAGGRYSPQLHVDVPVSFALEGLALSEIYRKRFQGARNQVLQAAEQIQASSYTGLGVTNNLRQLKKRLREWEQATSKNIMPPRRLEQSNLLDLTSSCIEFIRNIELSKPPQSQKTQQQDNIKQRISSLEYNIWKLDGALREFESLLSSSASQAAVNGTLLLKGKAGQGKTHLFCDLGDRAVQVRQPAVLILCGALSGRHVWSEIGQQLGLGDVGSEEIISAMQAAAEASNEPFLLLLDALNEVADPRAWQEELPRLFAEVAPTPWISVAVSVRSTFLKMVLPHDGLNNVIEVEHPGFDGQELEATERFFDVFGLEQPRIPLLTPEFTNPLFLKLYCESLHGMSLSAPQLGEVHLSQTFEQYLKQKESRITQHLRMDPELRPVRKAIDMFSKALIQVNRETLPYENASHLIDTCGHGHCEWPNTLFGQLLSEGVLSKDLAWDSGANEQSQVVRFTYQQFADYQVVSILLDPFGTDVASLQQALFPGEPFHQTILNAPPNWLEALAVLVPERFGIELQDAAIWDHNSYIQQSWDVTFVESIKIREPSATTRRTCSLLAEVRKRNPDLKDFILETRLSVATQPRHRLNAHSLHEALKAMSMPDRDLVWSIPTYDTLDEGGPLDRLIRWASRGRRPDCPHDVVELAAITLAWTFTSPNRILRDCATKALSQLLSTHLSVLPSLISRFAAVNDPYVIERLAVACHGAVLCGGTSESKAVVNAAAELKQIVFAKDQLPNLITRDAVRGIYEWCLHNKWIKNETYVKILPPYSSDLPEEPPTKEQITQKYDIRNQNNTSFHYPYSRILDSVFEMGDFGRYIIQSKIHYFIKYQLDENLPTERKWKMFDTVWAQRWVFQRVISLGWKPQYFAEFDDHHGWGTNTNHPGTDHKPERFGKKYQWIAFYELITRVADNFYMKPEYDGEIISYKGTWQLFNRDIDPTLPPPLRKRNMENEIEVGATFPEDSGHWWVPYGPRYHEDDPPAGDGWGTDSRDIPEFEPLVRYKDSDGKRWTVLYVQYSWTSGVSSSRLKRSRRRDFWSHIESWLIRPEQHDRIANYLKQRTLTNEQTNGRMPEGARRTDDAYLGELPWAISCGDSEHIWRPIQNYWNEEPIDSLEVSPSWEEYLWEGSISDCSIDDSVEAWCPSPILFKAGALTWLPGTREWQDSTGTSVAQFAETRGHRALLVREDWLQRTLRKADLAMVFRWLGEKWLFEKDQESYSNETVVGSWLEISSSASLKGRQWAFEQRRLKTRSVGSYAIEQRLENL